MSRFLAVMAALFLLGGEAAAGEALLLNTGTRNPYTTEDGKGFLDLLVAEAFGRVGRKAEVVVYAASKRALVNADQGIDDGAAMRVAGLNKTYTNLMPVPEKVIDNDFVGYTLGELLATGDWDSLKPYAVGHILGWKVFDGKLDHVKSVTKVKGPEQLLGLLANSRADVVLYERWQGLWRGREVGLNLKVLEPPLAKREMFMFLHRKHAALVEPVAEALRAMKADGTYQAIVDRTLTPLVVQ